MYSIDYCDLQCSSKYLILKFLGALCIIASVFAFAFGNLAYDNVRNVVGIFPNTRLNDVRFGTWWSGIPTFFCGIAGLYANNRAGLYACCIMGVTSTVISFAALIFDAVGATSVYSIRACTNAGNTQYSGDPSYITKLNVCYQFNRQFQENSGRCYCAASTTCAIFSYDSDCSYFLHTYPTQLRNSAITSGICFFISFIFAISSIMTTYNANAKKILQRQSMEITSTKVTSNHRSAVAVKQDEEKNEGMELENLEEKSPWESNNHSQHDNVDV